MTNKDEEGKGKGSFDAGIKTRTSESKEVICEGGRQPAAARSVRKIISSDNERTVILIIYK